MFAVGSVTTVKQKGRGVFLGYSLKNGTELQPRGAIACRTLLRSPPVFDSLVLPQIIDVDESNSLSYSEVNQMSAHQRART